MRCELKVSWEKTFPHRRICGKAGRFYIVRGVGMLVLFLCRRHARRLMALGLDLREASPLEVQSFGAAAERETVA
jgi:hypothetical protein